MRKYSPSLKPLTINGRNFPREYHESRSMYEARWRKELRKRGLTESQELEILKRKKK